MQERDRVLDPRPFSRKRGCRPLGPNLVLCLVQDVESGFKPPHHNMVQVGQCQQVVKLIPAEIRNFCIDGRSCVAAGRREQQAREDNQRLRRGGRSG